MTILKNTSSHIRLIYIWTRILGTPFWSLTSLLTYLLYKEMEITPFQIMLLVALKPVSSLLAPYWNQTIIKRPDLIRSNLIYANIFRYLPFLFLPWIHSSWFIILAFGLYMMLHRAVIPSWMELFKRHLPDELRKKTLSQSFIIDYIGSAVLTLGLGIFLDTFNGAWRFLFCTLGVLGLTSTWLIKTLPNFSLLEETDKKLTTTFRHSLLNPWKQSWNLLSQYPDFTAYQLGFMLWGGGIMLMHPALPSFFIDTLHLSFTEMSFAIAMCKGIGVALSSPYWRRFFGKMNIFFFTGFVALLSVAFPLFLLISPFHLSFLFLAYILYGIIQGGSELSWHISGVHFSQDKESTIFSNLNILTVGIRGCVIPLFGTLILTLTNSICVMILGGMLCSFASWYFLHYAQIHTQQALDRS